MTHFNILGDAQRSILRCPASRLFTAVAEDDGRPRKVTCGRCQRTRSFLALKP
jgi:hypothetical protein